MQKPFPPTNAAKIFKKDMHFDSKLVFNFKYLLPNHKVINKTKSLTTIKINKNSLFFIKRHLLNVLS